MKRPLYRGALHLTALVACLAASVGASAKVSAQTGDRCDLPNLIHTLPFIAEGSTTGLVDDYQPSLGRCGPLDPGFGQGPDAVYLFQSFSAQPESVVFQVEPRGWNAALYAFAQDCRFGPCVATSNAGGVGQPESFTIEVQPFVPYYIIVDGVGGASGEYFCAAHFTRETLCQTIATSPLAVVQNKKVGGGLIWKATTSPTWTIFSPSVCRREYRVPWPRVGAGGVAIWAAFARAEMLNNLAMGVPSFANAVIQLIGDYTLHCKPEDVGSVLCTAGFTTNGRQLAITEKPGGIAYSSVSTRILFMPFFIPAWPGRSFACASVPASAEDECSMVEAWNVGPVAVPEYVKCNNPYMVDFLLEAYVQRWGTGFARSQNHFLDVDLQCATCLPTDHGPSKLERRDITFDIQEARVSRSYPVQSPEMSVPAGFVAAFVSVESTQTLSALDASQGHGFGNKLYLTESVNVAPAFSDSTPPDTSALLTYESGSLAGFSSGALRAPSDLRFDGIGNFGFRLYAAAADSFDALTGGPVPGFGTVVSVDPAGTVATLASGLDAPGALDFAGGAPWDGSLYVTEIRNGEIRRVASDATVSTFATGLTLPTDLEFGADGFGTDLYVTESDSLFPDSIPHVDAGRIARFTSAGARSAFVSELHLPTSLVHTSGAVFGDYLYVALGDELDKAHVPLANTGRVVRVDAAGNVTPFADGLEQPMRLAFAPQGELDVAVQGGFVRITSDLVDAGETKSGPGGAAIRVQATPNPFTTETRIRIEVARAGPYRVDIFGPAGRRVNTLVDRRLDPGSYEVSWDGRDVEGRKLTSGIYWLRLASAGGESAIRRVVLLR